MSRAEALEVAHAAGIRVGIDGDGRLLEAMVPPPSALLDLPSHHKDGVVALLRPVGDNWSPEDWQIFFDERTRVAELKRGLIRTQAEAVAFACCVAEWLNRNPAYSQVGSCFGCGGAEHSHDPLLPFGIGRAGQVWLHSRCQPAWSAGRKAEAVSALAAMGIASPTEFPNDFGKNRGP